MQCYHGTLEACGVCDTIVDRFTSVLLPERGADAPGGVTTLCFRCCDDMVRFFARPTLGTLRTREVLGRRRFNVSANASSSPPSARSRSPQCRGLASSGCGTRP